MMEKCKICEKECKSVAALLAHVAQKHNLKSKEYYDRFFKTEDEGKCLTCGKCTKYISLVRGYNKYCSGGCALHSKDTTEKIKKSNLERYGVEYPFQSKEIQQKTQNTFLNKYGEKTPAKSDIVKKHTIETNIKKYNVAYPLQLNITQEKITKTCMQKNGGRGYASQKTREKAENTCLEKYNTKNYSLTEEYHDKVKETSKQKFGEEYYTQTDEYKERAKQTNLEKYGVENVFSSETIREKSKETCLKKYGVKNASQSKEIKEKIKQTNLKRYGVECVFQREDIQKNSHSKESLEKCYNTKKENHSFNKSKTEKELELKLRELFPDLITQYKSKKYPFACDYYIPSLDLYIEYNGMWTHGGHFFDKNNEDDVKRLNRLVEKSKNSKFYKTAIETWTQRDILKLNTALENNLNYIAWFNEEQAYDWIERMTHEKEKTKKTG